MHCSGIYAITENNPLHRTYTEKERKIKGSVSLLQSFQSLFLVPPSLVRPGRGRPVQARPAAGIAGPAAASTRGSRHHTRRLSVDLGHHAGPSRVVCISLQQHLASLFIESRLGVGTDQKTLDCLGGRGRGMSMRYL